MDKDELVRELASRTGYTLFDTKKVLDTLTDIFADAITDGEEIDVRGFGHLRIRKIAGGMHRFSKQDKMRLYPDSVRVYFSLSRNLRVLAKLDKKN